MNRLNEIENAIEKITGHEFDALVVLGANKQDGLGLQFVEGEAALVAILIADLYENYPQLEPMVKDAQQLKEGKLSDDLVKALLKILKEY